MALISMPKDLRKMIRNYLPFFSPVDECCVSGHDLASKWRISYVENCVCSALIGNQKWYPYTLEKCVVIASRRFLQNTDIVLKAYIPQHKQPERFGFRARCTLLDKESKKLLDISDLKGRLRRLLCPRGTCRHFLSPRTERLELRLKGLCRSDK